MGCRASLLYLGALCSVSLGFDWMQRKCLLLNAMLGAYHALYLNGHNPITSFAFREILIFFYRCFCQPLEVREMKSTTPLKAEILGVKEDPKESDGLVLRLAMALEEGRWIARDIGGSDPERMSAPRIVDYLKTTLGGLRGVTMSAEKVDGNKYPLMAAVNRAASAVARHDGRVVHLNYEPPNPAEVDTTLYLVGKGITYDTGGADIKANGVMAGMHRDKCGAAAIAGLFKTLGELQPPGLSVSAALAFVRNSVGAESYVADEILVARSGQRIRVGNTDAEGRMVMTDLLCEAKEKVLKFIQNLKRNQMFLPFGL
ncbi:putative aminopeptidase W07G4.4 [Fasciolopsis buskii]|uniref:Putative aminopeptidase W07G4.4 n=1 Tax=Fasciolopsis buskii TaxID=27845 RepID=A0A8E0RKZ9_9TREM|nr:putative aminopeptidase W07G4.4 [Fasciolopsis buski]